jgi:hypothetical protein
VIKKSAEMIDQPHALLTPADHYRDPDVRPCILIAFSWNICEASLPLVFRCINESQTSFEAMSGRLVIGRIRKDKFSGDVEKWSWMLNVTGPSSVVQMSGFGDDLDACKAALEADWQRWLDLASLGER